MALKTDYTNKTVNKDTHPAAHNLTNEAINELLLAFPSLEKIIEELDVGDVTFAADIRDKLIAAEIAKLEEAEPSDVKYPTVALLAKALASYRLADKLVVPRLTGSPIVNTSVAATTKVIYLVRCVVPKTGNLRDLSIFIKAKGEAKILGGVFDTGGAHANEYTRLSRLEAEMTPENEKWNVIYDPNLAVKKGQEIMLAAQLIFAASTTEFGRCGSGVLSTANATLLPPSFVPGEAVEPKLSGQKTLTEAGIPEKISDATLAVNNSAIALIARIS
jgi:hypothetical protein